MKLYLLRHGLAGARGTGDYPDDSVRPLTLEGKEKTRRIARALTRLDTSFDALLTSPYTRALQTAEIVAEVFKFKPKLVLAEELAPEGDARGLLARLKRDYAKAESVMLVGHEPYLSELISVLVTGKGDLALELKKGGLCRLRAEALRYGKCAVLESLLTPKQMIGPGERERDNS